MFANVNKSRLNIERAVIGRKDICGVLSTVACVLATATWLRGCLSQPVLYQND